METRVFSPSAYTFGEQRPHPQEISRGKKRKSESDKSEGANGTNPNAHLPGSTPAPPRTHSRDMPVLVTPELGKSFDSSGVSPSPAATPCRPPRIPPPPSKKKPQINNWTPIDPQSKTKSKPSPALDKQLLEQ